LETGFSASPVADLDATVSVDARPDPSFRVKGTLGISYPDTTTWPPQYADVAVPTVSELFCDYTAWGALFLRAGKQSVNWGSSRFFPVDNLPARVPVGFSPSSESYENSAGIGLKLTLPLGDQGITALILAKDGYFSNTSVPGLAEVGYGLLGDLTLGRIELSLGGYYELYLPPRALLVARTSLFGVDLCAEGIVAVPGSSGIAGACIANLYWEQPDVRFHILAEYLYNGESGQAYASDSAPGYPAGHAVAILAGFKKVFGSTIDAGVKWEHAFLDNSGFIMPALVFRPLSRVTLTLGALACYGPVASQIMNLNPDPGKRMTSLGLNLNVSGSF
jgi:hypothetical protein